MVEKPLAHPILYSFRRCPYAMRARLALAASGTVCALREVVLASKPPALLQISPKGTVPVLQMPSGEVIDQSLDIMLWALRRCDPWGWLPDADSDMERTLALIAQCDNSFKQALDRYKYPHRYGLLDGAAHREQGSVFLQLLETQLLAHGHLHRPASGAQFGLVDAAIAPFVRQFAHTDADWFACQPWPTLQAWLITFESSVLFHRVMHKYPAWVDGQPGIYFPDPEETFEPHCETSNSKH